MRPSVKGLTRFSNTANSGCKPMLKLTQLTRESAGTQPASTAILLSQHVISKVEASVQYGVDEACVRIQSDEQAPMICLGTVDGIAEQLTAIDDKLAEEVVTPLYALIEALELRISQLEKRS